jgi:AcrR family transcriptional regulator
VLVSQLVATTVKGNPPDKGAGGQARTRLARRAVIDAARALFLERGYQATTIEAVSDHSDVPVATVYRLFSSKLGILKAVLGRVDRRRRPGAVVAGAAPGGRAPRRA